MSVIYLTFENIAKYFGEDVHFTNILFNLLFNEKLMSKIEKKTAYQYPKYHSLSAINRWKSYHRKTNPNWIKSDLITYFNMNLNKMNKKEYKIPV